MENKVVSDTVILGDLIGSARVNDRRAAASKINRSVEAMSRRFRRDMLGAVAVRGIDELSLALKVPDRSYLLCSLLNEAVFPLRFRFAIVQGEIDVGRNSGDTASMDGPAFHGAADLMPALKKRNEHFGFSLVSPLDHYNRLLSQLGSLAGLIIDSRTEQQNLVIGRYRQLGHQAKVAKKLGVTQQAVSHSLRAASWRHLQRTEELITEILSQR
ncbi:hypothetical protein GF420_13990 [candidate division GN15 bacterium]|nr:hypothetical protein [candidate division GN15 bacterium]